LLFARGGRRRRQVVDLMLDKSAPMTSVFLAQTRHRHLEGGIDVRGAPPSGLTPNTAALREGGKSTCVRASSGRFLSEPIVVVFGVEIGVFGPSELESAVENTQNYVWNNIFVKLGLEIQRITNLKT
jgi:hypothetical protein